MRNLASFSICLFLLASLALPSCGEVRYQVTDLGLYADFGAVAVNDNGQVLGCSSEGHILIWENRVLTDTGVIGTPMDFNDHGQIVGYVKDPETAVDQAFMFEDGVAWSLGTFGGPNSMATGVNESGQVTGCADTIFGASRPFRYSDGEMVGLDASTDPTGRGVAINDKGEVAGFVVSNMGVWRAYFWREDGSVVDLGSLEGSVVVRGSRSGDVNENSQVVGTSYTSYSYDTSYGRLYYNHAFLWQDGMMTDLSTLVGTNGESQGRAINDTGQIVGDSYGYLDNVLRPDVGFLWQDGTMVSLTDLIPAGSGWQLTSPLDINNSGQIIGYSYYDGVKHSYLLTPVPEPSSLLTLLCGLGSIGSWTLSRRR